MRQRNIRPVGEQSVIVQRLLDSEVRSSPAAPPDWIHSRDTLRFVLALGSARIPGECQFISLNTDSTVLVDVLDNPASALPELCFTLPSGEVLDLVMYDGSVPLPVEVPHDEWAGIYATIRIQFIGGTGALRTPPPVVGGTLKRPRYE